MRPGIRESLLSTARALNAGGLNTGRSGNVSIRTDRGMLITPSGRDYASMDPADLVSVDMEGRAEGRHRPSSEWRFHLDIYRHREEAGAIVHAHPVYCTALACQGRGIPAFHYMVAVAGGRDIRCAGYATFGSQALSDAVITALRDRRACLMANHGMVAFGETAEQALELAVEIEYLANTYCHSLQVGEPCILDDEEMDRVIRKFADYRRGFS